METAGGVRTELLRRGGCTGTGQASREGGTSAATGDLSLVFVVKSPAGGEAREGPASSAASSFTAACIPQDRGAWQWCWQGGEGGTATTGHGTCDPIAGQLGVH